MGKHVLIIGGGISREDFVTVRDDSHRLNGREQQLHHQHSEPDLPASEEQSRLFDKVQKETGGVEKASKGLAELFSQLRNHC